MTYICGRDPAQRPTMLGVLVRIACRIGKGTVQDDMDGEVADIEGVELQVGNMTDPGADTISLPFEFLLGQITNSLATVALPLESFFQLLETSTAHQCHCMHDHKYT
jgi:hypothetical protein